MTIPVQEQEILLELVKKHNLCPKCGGNDSNCESYWPIIVEQHKINSNIPIHYREKTLKDIDEPKLKPVLKKLKDYVDLATYYRKSGKGLYLYGDPGTAKTSVGCIMLIELIKKRFSAYYTDLDEYLQSQFGSEDYDEDLDRDLKETIDFVLLDNMGREYHDSKGFKKVKIEELIRKRTDNRLPIIIISNLPEKELMASNAKLSSILKEHFLAPVHFDCPDYREKIRKENETGKK